MGEYKPIFIYAIKDKAEECYRIICNSAGIPTFKKIEVAKSDARMFAADLKLGELETIVIDIKPLLNRGIIPKHRIFGEGRELLEE